MGGQGEGGALPPFILAAAPFLIYSLCTSQQIIIIYIHVTSELKLLSSLTSLFQEKHLRFL